MTVLSRSRMALLAGSLVALRGTEKRVPLITPQIAGGTVPTLR